MHKTMGHAGGEQRQRQQRIGSEPRSLKTIRGGMRLHHALPHSLWQVGDMWRCSACNRAASCRKAKATLARSACRGNAVSRAIVWAMGGHAVTATNKKRAEAQLRESGAAPVVLQRAPPRRPKRPISPTPQNDDGMHGHGEQEELIDREIVDLQRQGDQFDHHDDYGDHHQAHHCDEHMSEEDPFGFDGPDMDNRPARR